MISIHSQDHKPQKPQATSSSGHQATVWPPRPPVPAPAPRPLHRPWHRHRAPSPPQWRQRWRRCRLRSWLPSHPPKPSPARLRRPSRSSRCSPDGKGLLVSFGTLKYCSESVVTKILRQVIFDEIWPAFGWFLWVEFMPRKCWKLHVGLQECRIRTPTWEFIQWSHFELRWAD